MFNILKNGTQHSSNTPQLEKAIGKDQVQSRSGGYVFNITDWEYLDRFLILGSAGTYYANGAQLTKEAASIVVDLLKKDGVGTVNKIVEVSRSGRAPRNDPALFALALASSSDYADNDTRQHAFDALPIVARTGTHLFHFAEFVNNLRGWGRGLRNAIANWYQLKPLNDLAYQVTKYQQRDGWSHVDLLRLSHPKPVDSGHADLYHYIINGWHGQFNEGQEQWNDRIWAHEQTRIVTSKDEIIRLIQKYHLTWESIPTEFLKSPAVWDALLQNMPVWAMVRNLGRMTNIGLLQPFSEASKRVVETLQDKDAIKKSKIHPMSIALGILTYGRGEGIRGSLSWQPVNIIQNALEDAFYTSLDNIQPTGKNIVVAIDVSGSMGVECAGYPISCANVASLMGLIIAKTEPYSQIVTFDTSLGVSRITTNSSLKEALSISYHGGGTDCTVPLRWAEKNNLPVDIVMLSDNESWAGDKHVFQALRDLRKKTGYISKLAIANMGASGYSVADPEDAYSLNCVGLDANLPTIINDFMK